MYEGHVGRTIEGPMGAASIMRQLGFISWESVQLSAGEMPAIQAYSDRFCRYSVLIVTGFWNLLKQLIRRLNYELC
jgi:hypothetical protein